MKNILLTIICVTFSISSFAAVIMTNEGKRIEDVTIQSENDTTIIYVQDGIEKSILFNRVSGILYDNGKYVDLSNVTYSNNNDDLQKTVDLYLNITDEIVIEEWSSKMEDIKEKKPSCKNQALIVYYETLITEFKRAREGGLIAYQAEKLAQKKAKNAEDKRMKECAKEEELHEVEEHKEKIEAIEAEITRLKQELTNVEIKDSVLLENEIKSTAECKMFANKLFNKKYQEIYSMCIKEGCTQDDAKIKAREVANLVKNQSLKECMGTAD